MDRRTKVLAVVALAGLGLFILDKIVNALWWEPWKEVSTQTALVRIDLDRARDIVDRRPAVDKGWKTIRDLLDKPRVPDVENHFYSHLDDLCDRVGANPDTKTSTPLRKGDFQEYVYDLKLKLSWVQFVELLVELHNSREFLKPLRIGITSMYEKEDRMDVDLKVSTISYQPVPKAGGK